MSATLEYRHAPRVVRPDMQPLGVAGRDPTGNEHQWLRYACSVHKTCLFSCSPHPVMLTQSPVPSKSRKVAWATSKPLPLLQKLVPHRLAVAYASLLWSLIYKNSLLSHFGRAGFARDCLHYHEVAGIRANAMCSSNIAQ